MNELTYLPSEILQYILESLPAKDILACTEVCLEFKMFCFPSAVD